MLIKQCLPVWATLQSLCQEMDETEDLISNPELFLNYVSEKKLYVNLLGVCFFVFFLIKDVNWKTFLKDSFTVGKLQLQEWCK